MFGIFDRPMEPADAAEVREVEALPITSDLEKYLCSSRRSRWAQMSSGGGRSATTPLTARR